MTNFTPQVTIFLRFKDNLPQFVGFKLTMAGTERQREIRRRRTRAKKLALLHKKSEKSSKQEKARNR